MVASRFPWLPCPRGSRCIVLEVMSGGPPGVLGDSPCAKLVREHRRVQESVGATPRSNTCRVFSWGSVGFCIQLITLPAPLVMHDGAPQAEKPPEKRRRLPHKGPVVKQDGRGRESGAPQQLGLNLEQVTSSLSSHVARRHPSGKRQAEEPPTCGACAVCRCLVGAIRSASALRLTSGMLQGRAAHGRREPR